MSSFVGDLWKKVGELKMSVSGGAASSAFPFIYNEQEIIRKVGPFTQFNGQDFESNPKKKEESVFRRVSVFICRERSEISEAKRILKSIKTMRHPRMLKFISAKESELEIILVTEWVEAFKIKNESDLEWKKWAKWSIKEVEVFLESATGRDNNFIFKENLWMTASGEVKIALFKEYSEEDFHVDLPEFTSKNDLIHLTETFDRLVTLSSGERLSLIRKLLSPNETLPKDFLKFLILPELIKSRKLVGQAGNEITLEEVQFLFIKGKELIIGNDTGGVGAGAVSDFMYLLSDFYCELLSGGNGSVQLIGCLLDQMSIEGKLSSLCNLFTEKYAQEKIYPLVASLTNHPIPIIRESALKALQGLCESKLGDKLIGNDVLRVLARMQGDVEGSLRVKAIEILSGAVWKRISDTLKTKICGPAVSRALQDPHIPCKRSGLALLKKGITLLPPSEIVTKLIPSLAGLFIDSDVRLRVEGFECMEQVVLPILKDKSIKDKSDKDNSGKDKSVEDKIESHATKISGTASVGKILETSYAAKIPTTPPVKTEMFNNVHSSKTTIKSNTNSNNLGKMKLGSIKKVV